MCLVIVAMAGSSCAEAAPPGRVAVPSESPSAISGKIATAPPGAIWDDGLAEVAVYDAHWRIYDRDRVFEARLITAKEPFDMERRVKADPPYTGRAIRDVLKENLIMEIQTENYPYRFLRTVFVFRDDPASWVKATVGSQEWCGNTFHEFRSWTTPPPPSGPGAIPGPGGTARLPAAAPPSREFHSYFDGEGDGVENLDARPGDLFRDQLFSTLRFAADDLKEKRARLWPSWVTNRAKLSLPVEAVIRPSVPETIRAAERDWLCRRIDIEAGSLKESYWFSNDAARVLVRYESSDGRRFLLKHVERRDYWTRK